MTREEKHNTIRQLQERISVLTNRMLRLSNYKVPADNLPKSFQLAFVFVALASEAVKCRTQLMIVSSQPIPSDFHSGGILTNHAEGEYIIPGKSYDCRSNIEALPDNGLQAHATFIDDLKKVNKELLEKSLSEAVKNENYEEAARIRDEILKEK